MGWFSSNWFLEEKSNNECPLQAHLRCHSPREKLSDPRIVTQHCMESLFDVVIFLNTRFVLLRRLFQKISAWRTKRNRFSWKANLTRSVQEQWTWMTLLRTTQLIDVTNFSFILFCIFFSLQITSRIQQRRNTFCLMLDNKRECWLLSKVNKIDTFSEL